MLTRKVKRSGVVHITTEQVPFSKKWRAAFEREAFRIAGPEWEKKLEHVGSTAVEGMSAKPYIDMAGTVNPEKFGYVPFGFQMKVFFREATDEGPFVRGFFVHVVNVERLVQFRDSLRNDASLCKRYSQLKASLAKAHPGNFLAYTSSCPQDRNCRSDCPIQPPNQFNSGDRQE